MPVGTTDWLADLLGPNIYDSGVLIQPNTNDLNFIGPTIAYNPATRQVDIIITSGAGSTLPGGTGHVMLTRQNGKIVPIPFDELIDPNTGKTPVRMLDTSTESFETALKLHTRLEPADLEDGPGADAIASVTNLDLAALRGRFA